MGFPFRGPEPTSDTEQAGILGTLLDWKARLNAGLNVPQAILAATQTIPGIASFATLTETIAGLISNKAVTPDNAWALVANPAGPNAITIAISTAQLDSIAKQSAQTAFRVVVMNKVTITTGNTIDRSLWYIAGDNTAYPLTPLLASSLAALTALAAQRTSRTSISFAANQTEGLLPDGTRYRWNGTAFTLVNPQPLLATNSGTFTVGGTFTRIPFTLPTGRDTEWDVATTSYKAPRDGWYEAQASLRYPDGVAAGGNIGLSVVSSTEPPDTRASWNGIPASPSASTNRYLQRASRLIYVQSGNTISGWAYYDGGSAGFTATAASLEIVPVRD